MRVHDYHLHDLAILDRGSRIMMTLSWDYPGDPQPRSIVEFTGVVCYRLSQTGGAIITSIDEMSAADVERDEQDFIVAVARADGLKFWNGTFAAFLRDLSANRIRAFRIASAIGFSGFVLAQDLRNYMHNHSTDPSPALGTSPAVQEPRHG